VLDVPGEAVGVAEEDVVSILGIPSPTLWVLTFLTRRRRELTAELEMSTLSSGRYTVLTGTLST